MKCGQIWPRYNDFMASPDKPRRPWYRPHLSTWVVTAFVALFFCLWNVAGYCRQREPTWDNAVWAYGWPATYLDRKVEWTNGPQPRKIDDSLTWRMGERVTDFFVAALLLNVLVIAGVCLLLGWLFEMWRRRRAHLLQVYLSELGVLTAVMCGTLAGGRYLFLSADATDRELKEADLDWLVRIEPGTPEFLHQRLPGNRCKVGDIVVGVNFLMVNDNNNISSLQMETICRQRSLRTLSTSCACPSNLWEMVAGCQQLEEIEVASDCLVDDDLAVLARLPRLRKLDLSEPTGASLRHVGEIKTLEDLTLNEWQASSCILNGEDLQPLTGLTLTKLYLSFHQSRRSECQLKAIGQMEHLRELRIDNKRLTRQDVTALRQLVALDDLTFVNCEFEDAEDGARLFSGLTKLRALSIKLDAVTASTGRAISELRGLEALGVHDSKSFDADAVWISQITSLKRLSHSVFHSGESVSSAGIVKLNQLPHLEELTFHGDDFRDDTIDALVQMKTLKKLELTCDHLSPAGMKRLETERPDLKVTYGNCY